MTNIRAQFSTQTSKKRAQFRARTSNDQNLHTIQHVNEKRSGRSMKTWAKICKHFTVHQPSENTNSSYICTNFYFITNPMTILAGRYVNRAGHKGIRAERKILRAERSTRWNTGYALLTLLWDLQYHIPGTPPLRIDGTTH